MGQRHERRCCANHDWRAVGNTDANSNSHTDSYCNSDSNSNAYGNTNCNASAYRDSNSDTHGNRHCNGNPDRNTDCYYYAYSKAYPITEGSFYTAASHNPTPKTVIAPVLVEGRFAKNGWLLPSDAKPHGAKRFIV